MKENIIIERFENSIGNIEVITAYEAIPGGGRGKRLWEKVFKNDQLESFQRWEELSWAEFCERYKDTHLYCSSCNPHPPKCEKKD